MFQITNVYIAYLHINFNCCRFVTLYYNYQLMSLIIGYIVIIFILKGKESVKTGWENIVFGKGKLKTDFQRFLLTWEQRKKTRHIF